jgi:hypothetical protein
MYVGAHSLDRFSAFRAILKNTLAYRNKLQRHKLSIGPPEMCPIVAATKVCPG